VIQIALGGWSHNDPGKWQPVFFSDIVSTQVNRAKFIKNLLGFLSQYGFDGVDFDWEYPGVEERGGKKEDGVYYTLLLQELRQAIQSDVKNYIVTFTAPTSYWYLRHFDVTNMVQYVDWINLMSYDLHGTWDTENPIGNQVLGHTNITEVDLALDLVSDSFSFASGKESKTGPEDTDNSNIPHDVANITT
jgi:chitinase